MNAASRTPDSNPFATRFTRPGAMEFKFGCGDPFGDRITDLIAILEANGRWGQIIGPHGSGKSTLLAQLVELLRHAGYRVFHVTLRDGQRRLPANEIPYEQFDARSGEKSIVVIDGFEQLSWWQRWLLKRRCRKRGAGLIITSHQSLGLPTLYETRPTLELVQRLATQLQAGGPRLVTYADVSAAVAGHGLNLREVLFALYDLYESRRSV